LTIANAAPPLRRLVDRKADMSKSRHRRHGFTLSRRQALTVTTIGVGLTAGTAVGVASAFDRPYRRPGDDDTLVVHVRDLAAGTLDVFTGTDRFQVHDRDLATRLAKAARRR
jgi:hypothetical protein